MGFLVRILASFRWVYPPCLIQPIYLIVIVVVVFRDQEGILACCTHIPPLVQQNLTDLHAIVRDARERLIEKVRLTGFS